jgi:hypothetical protein
MLVLVSRPPGLIVMAPQDYWMGYLEHPSAGGWWPMLGRLSMKIDDLLGLETHALGMRDVTVRTGGQGRDPELAGHYSVFSVSEVTERT